jgi:hypothetical protein
MDLTDGVSLLYPASFNQLMEIALVGQLTRQKVQPAQVLRSATVGRPS